MLYEEAKEEEAMTEIKVDDIMILPKNRIIWIEGRYRITVDNNKIIIEKYKGQKLEQKIEENLE